MVTEVKMWNSVDVSLFLESSTVTKIKIQNGHAFICRMLVVLASPVPMWEMKNKAGLTAEDLTTDLKYVVSNVLIT